MGSFVGVKQLQQQLEKMMSQDGYNVSQCLVQEWVDFDFEMRVYILPPQGADWPAGKILEPTRIECNAWGKPSEAKKEVLGQSNGCFSKLSAEACIDKWKGDTEAWAQAKQQAGEISQRLLAWLR